MHCKKLAGEELAKLYQTYMQQDFPPNELKPLSHILRSMEEGFGFALGIYEEGELAGYAVLILCEETSCALLDYFAILHDRRGKGMGHLAFSLCETYFKENLPGIEALYIESERVSAAEDEKQRLIRERRISFYLSCGCEMTALRSVLFGVDYSVLYRPLGESAKKSMEQTEEAAAGHRGEAGVMRMGEVYVEQAGKAGTKRMEKTHEKGGRHPSREALDALYQKMFKPEHYARCVSLTD